MSIINTEKFKYKKDFLDEFKLYNQIICIDLKSFFATVECILRKLDPFKTDLVVADTSRGKSSIILAVSPALKSKGVPGRCRIFELKKYLTSRQISKIIFAKPKMSYYIQISNEILKLYLKYFSKEDILVYSIDEVFIDVTSYLKLYNSTTYNLAKFLLKKLVEEFGMFATVGIGDNMVLAKFALDLEAKHRSDFIGHFSYDNLPEKLWTVTDLKSVWGIGRGYEKKLNDLGIKSMFDLANYDIYKLVKMLGVMGEELYLHANGIDVSKIQDQNQLSERKGFNQNQTLFKNTPKNQVRQKVKDLILQQVARLRNANMTTSIVQLYIGYSSTENQSHFQKQKKMKNSTMNLKLIDNEIMNIFDNEVLNLDIRRIGISLVGLQSFQGEQLNIFQQNKDTNELELEYASDCINQKYGDNTIIKASALTFESNLLERSKLIGGHNAI